VDAITAIASMNRVGIFPPNCMPHAKFDILVCTFNSMLQQGQIDQALVKIKGQAVSEFANVQFCTQSKAVRWGSCAKAGWKDSYHTSALSLTRIFGGKSCVELRLTAPPAALAADIRKATQFIEKMVVNVNGGGGYNNKPAAGNTGAPTESSANTTPEATTGGNAEGQ
jgi:hypothetical protein